jgi:hypothetical protein
MDAFDFSMNMDSLYRVRIEARLLDEERRKWIAMITMIATTKRRRMAM